MNETVDKHVHIFPPYINASPRPFPLSLRPQPPLYYHPPKVDSKVPVLNSLCNFYARLDSSCRHGHPTFKGHLNLHHDVSDFVYLFHLRFII